MPNPGRTSCEIRELPSEPPDSPERSLPVPGPEATTSASREPAMSIEILAPTTGPGQTPSDGHGAPADHRPALPELRPDRGHRALVRLRRLFRTARGGLRLRRRRADPDPRGDRASRLPASGGTPNCSRSTRRRPGRCRSGRRRSSPPIASRPSSASSGSGSRTTPATRRSASRTGPSRSPRPGPSSSASRRCAARRRAIWRAPRPRRRRPSACRPTSSSRPTSSRPRSTMRSRTARRSCRSRAPTTT